jgi:hypothetical protein
MFQFIRDFFLFLKGLLYFFFCRHYEIHKKLIGFDFDIMQRDFLTMSRGDFFLLYADLFQESDFVNISVVNFSLETIETLKELQWAFYYKLDPLIFFFVIFFNIVFVWFFFFFFKKREVFRYDRVDQFTSYQLNSKKFDFDLSSKITIVMFFLLVFLFYVLLLLYQPLYIYGFLGNFFVLKEYLLFCVYYFTFINTCVLVVFDKYYAPYYAVGYHQYVYWLTIIFHIMLLLEHSFSIFLYLIFLFLLIFIFSPRPRGSVLSRQDKLGSDSRGVNSHVEQIAVQRSSSITQPLNNESLEGEVALKSVFKSKAKNTF